MFIIFDLDGTLCDISHRLHFIQGKKRDYDAFHEACDKDAPKTAIIEMLNLFRGRAKLEIWSGRSDRVKGKTLEWLDRNNIPPYLLTNMREAGDRSSDVELKRSWLRRSIAEGDRPDLVFEDRTRVVDMWRSEGITCCQVDHWEKR